MENYLRLILKIEYLVNFILLTKFYLHMFQLNSYKIKKNWNWIKNNKFEVILKISIVFISIVLTLIRGGIFASVIIMIFGIYLNIQKKKAKIPLKYTNRILILITTLLILVSIFLIISYITNTILVMLAIINAFVPVLIMVSNYINKPIQNIRNNKYINEAKKIIDSSPDLIVIGVTGTYGKTSVKNYLAKILSCKYQVLVTPQNYNTTLGVVKTIRENLKATHQIFICEMGATNIGDIKEICDIVKPKYGIITSIGPQHLESFGSIENILATKFELAESVKENKGTIFLNYSNEFIRGYVEDIKNKIIYGENNAQFDYSANNIKSSYEGISFNINDEPIEFKTKIIGRHNAINLAGCIAISKSLGISYQDIQIQIRRLENVEHRLNVIKRADLTIIDDAYNSNPVSSKSALNTLNEFNGIKILVTPGLIELNNEEYKYNFELGEFAASICDYVFLIGEHSIPIRDGLISKNYNQENIFVTDRPENAMQMIRKLDIPGEKIVLLENDLPDNYK